MLVPALPLALVEDDPFQVGLIQEIAEEAGLTLLPYPSAEALLADGEVLGSLGAVLVDLGLPGMSGLQLMDEVRKRDPDLPVVIVSGQNKVETAMEALRQGAWDYLVKPIESFKLELALRKALDRRRLATQLRRLQGDERRSLGRLIGASPAMERVFQLIRSSLRTDITVLVQGESGTGKELVARAIHENGPRANGPFVSVNCAAIPRELMESEMFGHEKGSFTGAIQRRLGRFEEAHHGTLFLDEVGELDPALQAKLLRVLQEREIQRVGSSTPVPVDVRVVSATKQDLAQRILTSQFREDLYYRINAFTIHLPPLREREGDLDLLLEHFFHKHRASMGRLEIEGWDEEAEGALRAYSWPGNVRQLENAVCRALALAEDSNIRMQDLPLELRQAVGTQGLPAPDMPTPLSQGAALEPIHLMKKRSIQQAMEACGYNLAKAARELGVSRSTLYRHLPHAFRPHPRGTLKAG